MSTIQPLAARACPHCDSEGTLYMDGERLKCRACGYVEPHAKHEVEPPPTEAPKPHKKFTPSYAIMYQGELELWARAAFDSGQDSIRQDNYPEAIRNFKRALDTEPDFIDAHLWIARLTEDPAEKRDHLTSVLALDPNNQEALRELLVLDGRLTPEAAERARQMADPEHRTATDPVEAHSTALKCPVCGGDLTVDDANGRVVCKFCGYTGIHTPSKQVREESLAIAMLQRKGKSVQWQVGERLLHCNSCGAERTIPATKLSSRCPFCGSNQVIEQDTLGSFQQPDGLVSFTVSRDEAAKAIKEKLGGWSERVKGWFDNNKVEKAALDGLYLPFWVFDAFVDVTKTIIDNRTRQGQGRTAPVNPYTRTSIPEMVHNLPVCAVTSPPRNLTIQLGRYDLDAMVAYEPNLLAKYAAQLYSLDFDKASLDAREVIGKQMREKYSEHHDSEVKVNVFSGVKQMDFQLVLLPVWVATLVEADGDVRPALVNGQSGAVVLGKAEKRK